MTRGDDDAVDPRLAAGMRRQQELVEGLEGAGAQRMGWKAGLGSPAARERLGLSAPLVGTLLDTTRVESGATVDIAAWTAPVAEAEIAVRLAVDVPGTASATQALGSVGAFAPAIELVDLAPPPREPTSVLAGNIYHRNWITGAFVEVPVGTLRLAGRDITVEDGDGPVRTDDPEALTGTVGSVLVEVARMAERVGPGLRAGDVVLLGAVVPPRPAAPGGSFSVVLDGAGTVAVRFS